MRKLKEQELGHYVPSFFYIKVNTNEPLNNLNELRHQSLATFVHEYIHFLQDILTTWGLRHIVHTVDILKTANNAIYKSNENTFKLPFILPDDSPAKLNVDLVSVYIGDDTFPFHFNKIIAVNELSNGLVKNYEHVPYVQIKVENTLAHEKGEFHFGAICILESMAYLIESELFDNITPPQFPYRTVELVCEHLYPEIAKDKKNLIALCDIALNTTNPAHIFIDILRRMKEQSFSPTTPYDIFRFAMPYSFGYKEQQLNFKELFDKSSLHAEKSLIDYFTSKDQQPARDWIKATLEKARNLRMQESFSFLNFIEDKKEGAKKIIRFVSEIGTPLMSNNTGGYWCYHPQTHSESYAPLFKAINEIHNVLLGHQTYCSLKSHCKSLPEGDITCEHCDNAPWEMAKKDRLCAFAQMWKLWGLSSKEPIIHIE